MCRRLLQLKEDTTLLGAPKKPGQGPIPCLDNIKNANKLSNPKGLRPAVLPLEVKGLTRLPVVVSARSPAVGKPLATFALLYLTVE